ncbi:MAG: haloalkane dehalogenase [Parvularculales bacterium]
MKVLRTPDDRFNGLPDYNFAPHYKTVTAGEGVELRIHYLDEGPQTAPPVLLMHGEPSWCYLYRHIIPPLVAQGHRVIAPDLAGFGRSDKPTELTDYTYENHVRWMSDWLTALNLTDITFFGQDWGGLIGLRLVTAFPERFARVVVANTGLPVGTGSSPAFQQWVEFSQSVPELPIGDILQGGTVRTLSDDEKAAYHAPYPDASYMAGARRFPVLVPVTPEHDSVAENKQAWKVLESFERPLLTAFSDSDPVSAGGDKIFQEKVPGAKGQPHTTITQGGHFLQEDKPKEIADLIHRFINNG